MFSHKKYLLFLSCFKVYRYLTFLSVDLPKKPVNRDSRLTHGV
ncbi:hypothetical protein CHCC14814_0528 [Bacillus paralicheniformis]|nr:hypothetical protein CHCC14814_0528 [Bacillus paralicheniformis]